MEYFRKHGNLLKKFVILMVISSLIILAYQKLWYGNLQIVNLDGYETIELDNQRYAASIFESIKVRPGLHHIKAYGPLMKTEDIKIDVNPFRTKQVSLASTASPKAYVIQEVVGTNLNAEFMLLHGEILENNYWIVGVVGLKDSAAITSVDVYRYNGSGWDLMISGIDYATGVPAAEKFPSSVQRYLETIERDDE